MGTLAPRAEWFYEVDGERRGPLTLAQMRDLVQVGAIRRHTMVTAPGASESSTAGSCRALVVAPTHDSILFPQGHSKLASLSMLLGIASIVPFVGYVGLVVTVFAAAELRKHRELKGDGRAAIGGLLSLFFAFLYTWVLFH